MGTLLKRILEEKGMDIVVFVDISTAPYATSMGYKTAILLVMALSKQFILDSVNGRPVQDEYLIKEEQTESLADWLSTYLSNKGYSAFSQSERNNRRHGFIEQAYCDPGLNQGVSRLPQKAIARMGGLGFIGKNNLLVTEQYGCAITLCSVLTNAPIPAENKAPIASKCGSCRRCADICPTGAIQGLEWQGNSGRDLMIQVSRCCCALKCMLNCPFTLAYANR